jgi:hypothetical protein
MRVVWVGDRELPWGSTSSFPGSTGQLSPLFTEMPTLSLFYLHSHISSTDPFPDAAEDHTCPARTRPISAWKTRRKTGRIIYVPPYPPLIRPWSSLADTSPSRARNRHTLSLPPPSSRAHSSPPPVCSPPPPPLLPPLGAAARSLSTRAGGRSAARALPRDR